MILRRLVLPVILLVTLTAPRAEAQTSFMPMVGYDLSLADGALFVGAAAEFGLLPRILPVGLAIRPSAEFYFIPGVDAFQINGEAVANIGLPGFGLYGGAGVGVLIFNPEIAESTVDLGVNLLGGARFGSGLAVPFVQARLTTAAQTRFQLMGGVRLGL